MKSSFSHTILFLIGKSLLFASQYPVCLYDHEASRKNENDADGKTDSRLHEERFCCRAVFREYRIH